MDELHEVKASLRRYVERGILPGGFLRAVLENDLCGAVARADDESLANLRAIVVFVYNELPSGCWGSRDHVVRWVEASRERNSVSHETGPREGGPV